MSADYSDSQETAKRMDEAAHKLRELAAAVGRARQVKEFSSDRRKQALALEVAKRLKAGESAVAAEHLARASSGYGFTLAQLAEDDYHAHEVIAQWDATWAIFESARSLLSYEKETIRNLEG